MSFNKIFISILVLFGLFLGPAAGAAESQDQTDIEIARIKLEILHQNLNWEAGETSLSRLSPLQKRKRLGRNYTRELDALKLRLSSEPMALPNKLDWTNIGGKNYLTRIKDQGECGSCWAFSTLGVIEAIYNIENNKYSTQTVNTFIWSEKRRSLARIAALAYPNLSEQDLVSCSTAGNCEGGWESDALIFIKNRGVVTEQCFPYKAEDVSCVLCVDWKKKLTKIKDWSWVTRASVDRAAVKSALQNGPLIFYMEVYSDFYHYKSGIYEPIASATLESGHSVVLVGYNEQEKYWICKNSWSTDWGENGYFKIKYDECETGSFVLQVKDVTLENKSPKLDPVPDLMAKEGSELNYRMTGSDPDGDRLTFSASNLPRGADMYTNGIFEWTPTYTQSGDYFIPVRVTDGVLEDSRTVKVTVINVKKGKGKY